VPEANDAARRPVPLLETLVGRYQPGFAGRIRVYLGEMFPVPLRLLMAVLLCASFAKVLARVHRWPVAPTVRDFLLGSGSVFATMLVLRLMDELKDREVDGRLFAWRPLPSGRVLESDIRLALFLVSAVFVAAHIGQGLSLWTALGVLGYATLMFRWFFLPEVMRPRLLLTLATHNPVIAVLLLHLVVIAAEARGRGLGDLDRGALLPLIVIYWAPVFAWEIARKIRSPGEEDAYVTYSRLFGPADAVLLVAAAQTLALGLGLRLGHVHGLHAAWAACAGVGWAIAQAAHVRFLLRPDARSSRLRPFAELFFLAVLLGGLFS
jgi:4-hydroxybenzoate polyprenyltransferase